MRLTSWPHSCNFVVLIVICFGYFIWYIMYYSACLFLVFYMQPLLEYLAYEIIFRDEKNERSAWKQWKCGYVQDKQNSELME